MTKTKTVNTIQNSSRQKQIAHGNSKSLTAKTNRLRQQQIAHGKNKSLAATANRSRQKQIAHGKSQSGGQRFLVSGRTTTWCNTTTRSSRPGRFPAFFRNVSLPWIRVIMFCSKCGFRPWLHETGTNSDRYDFRSVSIQMLLTVYMKPVWKIFSCRFHSFRLLNRHEWLRPVWSRTTEPCKHEPGRLYVGRWNERVRAKRCDAVDWGLLKRGDSKLLTHSNLDV